MRDALTASAANRQLFFVLADADSCKCDSLTLASGSHAIKLADGKVKVLIMCDAEKISSLKHADQLILQAGADRSESCSAVDRTHRRRPHT